MERQTDVRPIDELLQEARKHAEKSGVEFPEADLRLAHSCATGDEVAVARFNTRFTDTLTGVARRFASTPSHFDDLLQLLLEHLLVPRANKPPRVADYQGIGSLEGWIRVASVRRLVDERRRAGRRERDEPHAGEILERLGSEVSWEVSFLKSRYRDAFRKAFAVAVGRLTSEQRNFLKYQILEGLTLDQIAQLHGLHRSSVDRRLQAARRFLLSETRLVLAEALQIDRRELESVMGLIESRLDASVSRLLGSS